MKPTNYRNNNEENWSSNEDSQSYPRGNYRVDERGNPIYPVRESSINDDFIDQDYFDTEEFNKDDFNRAIQYQEWQANYHQPTDDYNYQQNQRINSSQLNQPPLSSYNAESSRQRYQSKEKPSWYHRLLIRSKKSASASLPKGRIKLFSVYGLIYLIMIWAGFQLLPFNQVNQLLVTGNETVPSQNIETSSRILPYDSKEQVLAQQESIEGKIIQENPLVAEVNFDTSDWRYVQLDVNENQFVGYVNSDNTTYFVLSNGETVVTSDEQTDPLQQNIPHLSDFHSQEKLEAVAEELGKVDPTLLSQMEQIYLSTNPNKSNTIEVQMTDGNIIKALINTFSQKVQYYPQMLSQLNGQTGIINLEVGAYFTPNVNNANSVKLDTNLDN